MKKAKEDLTRISHELEEETAKNGELRDKLAGSANLQDHCSRLEGQVAQLRSSLASVQVSSHLRMKIKAYRCTII